MPATLTSYRLPIAASLFHVERSEDELSDHDSDAHRREQHHGAEPRGTFFALWGRHALCLLWLLFTAALRVIELRMVSAASIRNERVCPQ